MVDLNILKIAFPGSDGNRAVLDVEGVKAGLESKIQAAVERIGKLESGDFQYAYKDYTSSTNQGEMTVGVTYLVPQTQDNTFIALDPETNKPLQSSQTIHHFIPCVKSSGGTVTQGAPFNTQANITDVAYTNKTNTFTAKQTFTGGAERAKATWAGLGDNDIPVKAEIAEAIGAGGAGLKKLTDVIGADAEYATLQNKANNLKDLTTVEATTVLFKANKYDRDTSSFDPNYTGNAFALGVQDKANKALGSLAFNTDTNGTAVSLSVNHDDRNTSGFSVAKDGAKYAAKMAVYDASGEQAIKLKNNGNAWQAEAPSTPDTASANEIVTADWATKKIDEAKASIKTTLVDLTDTNISGPTDKQVLKYDNGTSKWINADPVKVADQLPSEDLMEEGVIYLQSSADAQAGDILQDGTLVQKGIVQLSSTLGADETKAATPKLVNDLDAQVVKLAGAQTIEGAKKFAQPLTTIKPAAASDNGVPVLVLESTTPIGGSEVSPKLIIATRTEGSDYGYQGGLVIGKPDEPEESIAMNFKSSMTFKGPNSGTKISGFEITGVTGFGLSLSPDNLSFPPTPTAGSLLIKGHGTKCKMSVSTYDGFILPDNTEVNKLTCTGAVNLETLETSGNITCASRTRTADLLVTTSAKFTNAPLSFAEPTNELHLVTKKYVDGLQARGGIAGTGARGKTAGYELVGELTGSQTITKDSADTTKILTTGSVTLTFTPAAANEVATKVIALNATGITTLNISGASWANKGKAPTWGQQGKNLVLVASFILGKVILSVFENDQ